MEPTSKTGKPSSRGSTAAPNSYAVPTFPSPSRTPDPPPRSETKGMGWLLLVPIACCGGPLIVAALAAAGAAVWGGLGAAVAVIAIAATFLVVRRRRAASCCAPGAPRGGLNAGRDRPPPPMTARQP